MFESRNYFIFIRGVIIISLISVVHTKLTAQTSTTVFNETGVVDGSNNPVLPTGWQLSDKTRLYIGDGGLDGTYGNNTNNIVSTNVDFDIVKNGYFLLENVAWGRQSTGLTVYTPYIDAIYTGVYDLSSYSYSYLTIDLGSYNPKQLSGSRSTVKVDISYDGGSTYTESQVFEAYINIYPATSKINFKLSKVSNAVKFKISNYAQEAPAYNIISNVYAQKAVALKITNIKLTGVSGQVTAKNQDGNNQVLDGFETLPTNLYSAALANGSAGIQLNDKTNGGLSSAVKTGNGSLFFQNSQNWGDIRQHFYVIHDNSGVDKNISFYWKSLEVMSGGGQLNVNVSYSLNNGITYTSLGDIRRSDGAWNNFSATLPGNLNKDIIIRFISSDNYYKTGYNDWIALDDLNISDKCSGTPIAGTITSSSMTSATNGTVLLSLTNSTANNTTLYGVSQKWQYYVAAFNQYADWAPSISGLTTTQTIGPYNNVFRSGVYCATTNTWAYTSPITIQLDNTAPTFTVKSISSNNSKLSTRAKVGDVISLSLTASEQLQNLPSVLIAGQTATVTGINSTTFTATYTVTNSTTQGVAAINISNYSDLSGNAGVTTSGTTDASAVNIDYSAPTISVLSIVSNNPNNASVAKLGDLITVNLTASESISLPTISIAGNTLTVTGSAGTYSATYLVSASSLEGGGISVLFEDVAGNTGTNVSSTTNGSNVIIDKTNPTISSATLSWGSVIDGTELAASGTITATLSGIEDGVTISALINGISSTATVNSNSATFIIPQTTLGTLVNNNTYTVTIYGNDLAGNSASSLLVNFSVNLGAENSSATIPKQPITFPYYQNFETNGVAAYPSDWQNQIIYASQTSSKISTISSSSNPSLSPISISQGSGSNIIKYESSNTLTGGTSTKERLVLPPFNTSSTPGNFGLNFYMFNQNIASSSNLAEGIQVEYTLDQGTSWVEIPGAYFSRHNPFLPLNTGSWELKGVQLPSFLGNPEVYISLTFKSAAQQNIYIDDVSINEYCTLPMDAGSTAFGTVVNGNVTVTINSGNSTPTGYTIVRYSSGSTVTKPSDGKIYHVGEALGLGTVVYSNTNTSTSFTFNDTGLKIGTYSYQVYPYSICTLTSNLYNFSPVYNTSSPAGTLTLTACEAMQAVIKVAPGQAEIGGAQYSSLTNAINAIATCGITQPTIIELAGSYTSSTQVILPPISSASSINTITIRPELSHPGFTLQSNQLTTEIPALTFSSTAYWIIDGRPGGEGVLSAITIKNVYNGTNKSPAISFASSLLGSHDNTLKYLKILSNNKNTASGAIFFGSISGSATTGNSNNTITNCDISYATIKQLANAIYSDGASGKINNSNTISNNNIYDFFLLNNASNGILLNSFSDYWNINGNNFYQTTNVSIEANVAMSAINLGVINGTNITNNYFGGASNDHSGVLDFGGYNKVNGPLSFITATSGVGTISPTSIQGNTISNISIYAKNTNSNTTNIDYPILNLGKGNFEIGTITGNLFGSLSSNNSINFYLSSNASNAQQVNTGYIIKITNSNDNDIVKIKNNSFGGIRVGLGAGSTLSTNANFKYPLYLINIYSDQNSLTGAQINIINNIIGNSNAIINQTLNNSSLYAIYTSSYNANLNQITNNHISNLVANGNAGSTTDVAAIFTYNNKTYATPYTGNNGFYNIESNLIKDISGLGNIYGIYNICGKQNSGSKSTVSANYISNLKSNSTSSSLVKGIYFEGPFQSQQTSSKRATVNNNIIYSLNAITSASTIVGIEIGDQAGAQDYIFNNMIRLGVDNLGNPINSDIAIYGIYQSGAVTSGSAFFNNSIYIGGSGTTETSAMYTRATDKASSDYRVIKNNILFNERSGGVHYSLKNDNATGMTSSSYINYNNYYNGISNHLLVKHGATTYNSLSSLQSNVDNKAISLDPKFISKNGAENIVDLHLVSGNVTNAMESKGCVIDAGTTGQMLTGFVPFKDIDSQVRPFTSAVYSGTTYDLGADEIDARPFVPISITSISTSKANGTYGVGEIIPITVSFNSPVTVVGSPTISLNSGANSSTSIAVYNSGSGTNTLTFNYTVAAGNQTNTLDYVSTTALGIPSGASINDAGGYPATTTLPTPGAHFSKSIAIDAVQPILNSVSISSNNANSAKAKPGDVISISITASESITLPTVTIVGQSATVTGTGGSYTATITVNSNATDGQVGISISNYYDLLNNPGTEVSSSTNSSTVVIDKSVPILNAVTISSNNTSSSSKAKVGDVISVQLTSNEIINAPTISIAGNTVSATGSGTSWAGTLTVTSVTTEGQVDISINYSDLVGNTGSPIFSTTNSSFVDVDVTTPTISQLTIVSNNSDPSKAKAGDLITVNLTASETIISPTISIAGNVITATGSGAVWSATYTVTSLTTSGLVNLSVSNLRDVTGNIISNLSSTTNSSTVEVDLIAPTISISSSPANLRSGQTSIITFALSEATNDFIQSDVTVSGGSLGNWNVVNGSTYTAEFTPTANSSANGVIDVAVTKFTDLSGNTNSAASNTVTISIDNTMPTLSSVTISSNNGSITSKAKLGDIITLSLTASESIAAPTVTIAGQSATVTGTAGNYTATYTVTSSAPNGTASITIDFSDLAGNPGTQVLAITSGSNVIIDNELPVISTITTSFGANLNITETANSQTITVTTTGVEDGQILSISIGSITPLFDATVTNNVAIFTISPSSLSSLTADFDVTANVYDQVGNTATPTTSSYTVDRIAPTLSLITISSNNSNTSKAKVGDIISLSLTASETIQTPSVTIAGQSATVVGSGGTYTATYTVTSTTNEGSATISVTFSDLAGNNGTATATTNSSSVVVDRTTPTLNPVAISSSNANPAKAKVGDVISVSITANESIATPTVTIAGQSATVTGTGGTYTATYTVATPITEGAVAISITYSDLAGNAGTAVSSTTNSSTVTVDVTAPSGYNFTFLNTSVNAANQSNTTLNLVSPEAGTTYSVNVISGTFSMMGISAGNIGSPAISSISGIDLTGFPDGNLTVELVLTDASGNSGSVISHNTTKDVIVPTITSVNSTVTNGNYKAGQVIPIIVTFSEPVNVTGTPQLTLETGSSDAVVSYASGSGTSTVTFNYTIGAGENSTDLNYVSTTALALNSGTINDLGNNPATLTLPALNAAASLGGSANLVVDTQAPTLNPVAISSSNANPAKAKVGDIISVSITASESIATPTVTIAGQSATVTGTGGTYTATYTVATPITEGVAAISITYSDLAGNAGTVVASTTNSSTVTVDVSNPTISSLLISSSNANSALAKVGDVITLTLTASESIATPTVSIAGGTVSMTGSGGTYTATYTVTSSTPQGTASISVSFADLSGNAGTMTSTTNTSSVVVDRAAPTMSIVSNPANLRSGQTSTLTFTISESVTDFVAGDITISGGSIGTLSGTGTTYTAEFTPTANSNINGVIDVAVNKFTDAAGNSNTAASNTVTISIDNTLPTVTITSSTTALKAGETATITFTFSEAVLGFDLSDVTMNNGAFGTLSGTGSSYTATFTPNANVEGTSSISIGATTFTDLAGNDNGVTASLAPLNIDTQVPSIGSSTLSWGTSLNNSEIGSNGTVTLALTNVEDGRTVSVSVNSQTYTATVSSNAATITIPSADLTALTDGGTYTVTTNVNDAAGNAAPAGTVTFTVDRTLPTITSVTTSAGTVINATESASAATVTVNTSGTENGQVVSVVLNSQTYSATVSSNVATITIPASALTALTDGGTYTVTTNVSDAAANAANQNSFSISVDKTKPTTTISSSMANLKIGQSATLTITLSEAATDFVAGDITIAGGTIGTLSGTGRNYSATFTPTSNYEGTASITLASNQFTDPNGNPNDESSNTANAISIAVDTKAPTMTIASNPANLRSGQSATLTFTISEAVSDFVAGDITISGGSIGTLSGTGTTYAAEFTPTANSNASGVIDVDVNKFTDAAGNANTSASNNVTISIDNTVPTVVITSSASALKAGETATITFTFSEAVLGFDLTDVTLNYGTLGTLSGTGSVYTAAFTPNTNVEGTSTISLGANTFTDLAGNNNAVPASLAPLNIDTKVPSIGSSTLSWGTSLNSAETATNGSVTLALTNVEDGRTVSVSVNSQTYTATVASSVATVIIPAANLAALSNGGTYTVTTNVSDAAGNAAPAGTSTFTVDKTAPTLTAVTITSNNTPTNLAKSGNTITLSITASESIQTPTVSIAGVAATVSGSGTIYTATYPVIATSTSGVAAILISYSDVAGNPGVNRTTTTNSSNVTIDRTAPTMTILSSASTFKIGSTATITFTASEATTNFIQSDVTVAGGTLTNWTAVSSTVYRATFTPNANTALNGNLSVAATKFTDAAGNNNGVSNNVSFIIDTFRPTVSLTSNVNSVNGNQTATINFTFNESVAGFAASDIVVTNGSLGALTGSGSAYSSVFTPAANFNGSASISVASNTFSDTIGNSNTDGAEANNTYTLSVDSGIPALSSVGIQSSNADPALGNIGDVISINFVSTETVNTPIVTIDGQTAFVSGDGTNWTASYVVINSTNDGPLAFTIDYTDVAGNAGTTVTTATDGSEVSVLKNQTPIDNSSDITLSQDSPDQSINLLAGIVDPEGDPLTVSNVTISYSIENVVTNQPVVINSTLLTKFQDVVSTSDLTGTNLFIEMSKSKFLNGSQKGQINIAYVVTDGNNNLNANAVLNIIGANDQPTGSAVTLNQVVINGQNMGIPLTEGVGVSTNVPGIDPDDDSVTYTLDQNSSVSNGQFVFNPDGSFNFLPDANYYGEQEFDYYIKDQSGVLNGPYKVKIVIAENPDIDGIPSKLEEVAPNGGDVNGDGIPDRKQNNITNVPLGSFADYQAGIDWANGVPGATRPSTSKVGSLLIGSLPGGKSGLDSLDLDPNAKFRNVALLPTPNIANTDRQFSSDLYQFTIEGLLTNAADTLSPRLPLRDLDPTRPGLQVRAVLEFPVGMKGSTYLKQNKAGEWKSFKDDQNLATYDDGATLIDLDNDPSTIERIVLTFTDGAFGDKDTLVNNSISDPGGLGIIKPVIDDATLPTRAEGVATATALFNVFDRNSRLDVDEEGQKLYYTIDSTNNSAAVRAAVKIDSLTGVISVRDAGGFDYESFVDANGLAKFNIVVKATDTDGNFDLATYTQTITNVDEYPRIISGKTVSYREKQPTTVAVIKVQTLPDYQDLTSFSILSGLDGAFFTIDPATGVLRFKNSPNYDDKPVYTLDIQSQDLSGKTDHAVFTVNIIDIDADNDGILDDEEIGPDPSNPIDTDKDGIPDYKDTDSDGDGIPDLLESKADTDKDGIPDYLDTDSDGDGILDKIEAGPNPLKPLDSDSDGIPDFRELDADNDGYLDSYEKSIDTDKDGIPDFQDTDSDGDGILDKEEDDLDFGNIKDCDHDGIENRIDPDVCDLILPQIITPNGDGLNDVLKIPGIMRLQPNHITIINRWGAVVYDAENYQNTWGGTGDSGELPDGTYYYVVDFKGAKPTISNFIYLDRTGK